MVLKDSQMELPTPGKLSRMLTPPQDCSKMQDFQQLLHLFTVVIVAEMQVIFNQCKEAFQYGKDLQKWDTLVPHLSGVAKENQFQMVSINRVLVIAGSLLLLLLLLNNQRESRELSGTTAMIRMVHSDTTSGSRTNGMESISMIVFHPGHGDLNSDLGLLRDLRTELGGCHSWRRHMPNLIRTTRELLPVWDMKVLEP